MTVDADAIIVGAGPAGSSAAYHLARTGRRVLLLDRQSFPRDKSCGDGLTRSAARLLNEMGVLDKLAPFQKTRGVRIVMRGEGVRSFEYPAESGTSGWGLVVPRLELDQILCQHAVHHGAILWENALVTNLLLESGRVVGVEARHRNQRTILRAKIVIAADGASSRLARQASLVNPQAYTTGYAIRLYLANLIGLDDLLEIYAPLTDVTERYLLPSYGWVFSTGPSTANVGVGLFRRERGANIRKMLEQFLHTLRLQDSRFHNARICGPPKGAPLRFDFAPEQCAKEGLFLVGDAAGMISPFTGEGISYALESGKIAAKVIEDSLVHGVVTPDHQEYKRELARCYVGYFETGRQAAQRYLFTWHVLSATFGNDRPLFALCRRAALFPEGISEPSGYGIMEDVTPCIAKDSFRLSADLASVGEVLNETVRRDWPFLAKYSALTRDTSKIPFRPALFLLIGSYLGEAQSVQTILAGAAVELGYLAAVAQFSLMEEPEGESDRLSRPANWSNLFALTLGDFLLGSAYQQAARAGGQASQTIAWALSRVCEARVDELRHASDLGCSVESYLDITTRKTGTLFQLPCRLGAILGGASETQVQALAHYGEFFGVAHQLVDDILEVEGRCSVIGLSTRADPSEGLFSAPLSFALEKPGYEREELLELAKKRKPSQPVERILVLMKQSGATSRVMELAHEFTVRAKQSLDILPPSAWVISLKRLADYSLNRVNVEGPPRS